MSTATLRFRDHEEFHRAALQMALGGAAASLAAYLSTGSVTSPLAMIMLAAGVALGALAPSLRTAPRELLIRGTLVGLAGGALAVLPHYGEPATGVTLFGGLFAASLAWGMRGRRLLLAIASGALVAVFARHALASIVTAQELSSIPAWLSATIGGTAFSLVSVFAIVPRHIELRRDPVGERYSRVQSGLTGEVRELVERGYALWAQSDVALRDQGTHRATLQDGVIRLFDVAGRWSAAEGEVSQRGASELVTRIEELDRRIENSKDTVAREQYQAARGALAEQLRYLENIGTSRERVLARMHNYLAAMERLRLAVINRDSANASRSTDVQPLLTDVESLGRDIDLCAEAFDELDA